jgi:hypothetical protein
MDPGPQMILPSISDLQGRISRLERRLDSMQVVLRKGYTEEGYVSLFNKFVVKRQGRLETSLPNAVPGSASGGSAQNDTPP